MNSSAEVTVTVAICTRNRATLLAAAIESVLDQLRPCSAELLVVDNGSTDDTAEVAQAIARQREDVSYLFEGVPGLSRARNAALSWSKAPVVAFLDDDATADPGWVSAVKAAFMASDVDAAGGPVRLGFDDVAPAWLAVPSDATSMLGALDLGGTDHDLVPPQGPYGCNMAVRTTAALGVGGFDLRLGHSANKLGAAEETELFSRLHRAGGRIRWTAGMAITHRVPPERTDMRYLLRRGFAVGRGQAATDLKQDRLARRVRFRRAASSLRSAFLAVPRPVRRDPTVPPGGWRLGWCESSIHAGRGVQLLLSRSA